MTVRVETTRLEIQTWADEYGTWHVRINSQTDMCSGRFLEAVAFAAIRDEIEQRHQADALAGVELVDSYLSPDYDDSTVHEYREMA